jgi:enoyl-CoA hydratase
VDYQRYRELEVTREAGVVTVTLNRPEVRNAIGGELHDELGTIFTDLDQDHECDVAVLTGAGDCFSAGGDLNWIHGLCGNPVVSSAAGRVKKPIIAKVRGPAIGLGCSLALFCDFVYATPDAAFADPHVSVGLVAGDGGALIWPQLIGYARARRYLLTGDAIRGSEAAEIGLITDAVPSEELDDVVATMATRLAGGATQAIKFTKSSINAGLKLMANSVLDRAAALETVTQMMNDNRSAIEAFLAKDKPRFTGT